MQCPHCGSKKCRSHGTRRNKQRFHCQDCNKWFSIIKETKVIKEEKQELTNWRQLTSIAKEHQKIRDNNNPSFTSASVSIDKKGIVLIPIGDSHLGSDGVDYLQFEETIDLIKEKDLYTAFIGDIIDMFHSTFKSAKPIFDQVLNLDEQYILFRSLLEEIDSRLVAATFGNHETSRLENLLGIDLFGRMQSKLCPYFQGIGKLFLQVGKIKYEIVLTHSGKGKSQFNPLHSLHRIDREIVSGDLFIAGHNHNQAIGSFEVRGRQVPAIKVGTFKKNDPFSERYYRFGEGYNTLPAVFLSGKEKKIILFEDVRDAILYRDAYLVVI